MKEDFKEELEWYKDNGFISNFDPSQGVLMRGGLFCWTNRYGGTSYVYSNDDGEVEFILRYCASGIDVWRDEDALIIGDDEHEADGHPDFRSPSPEEMEQLIVATYGSVFPMIQKYLTPGGKIEKGDREYLESMEFRIPRAFRRYITRMDYPAFLRTPYWRIVRTIAIERQKKCQICGSKHNLEVHHPDYSFHGEEIWNIDKLMVLCHDCHKKFHESHKNESDSISELLKKGISTARVNKTNEE